MTPRPFRVAAALLLAPPIGCLVAVTALSVASGQSDGFLFMVMAMSIVSLGLTLLLALPAYLLLIRFWRVRLVECLVAGSLIGVVPSVVGEFIRPHSNYSAGDSGGETVINGERTPHGVRVVIREGVYQAGFGCAIGALFWIIAFYRPSRRQEAASEASARRSEA